MCVLYDFVTVWHFHLEHQEFAAPGACEELNCKGRLCAKCHKCRDWHFDGDQGTWNWIQNYKNWSSEDCERWNSGVYACFKKRTGATCFDRVGRLRVGRRDDGYYVYYLRGVGYLLRHVCLCDRH
ncbi:unnamed protein product [Rotaria sp. Silwood1]|nr:unnamed protein product [Rotaria sp. Silwood1]CAF1631852.1 unnamed protein product [Rotaria sp. Silwood1]